MLGAIIGDIVGSIYEFNNIKKKDFPFFTKDNFFTDDTIMTCAVCKALMNCKGDYSNLQGKVKDTMISFGRRYKPNGKIGYGQMFLEWLKDPMPYQSWGNGAAMRVSPVAYFAKNEEELKRLSKAVTIISHNHEEAIKGAEATSLCIFMALNGATKQEIAQRIENEYYSLDFNYKKLVKHYTFKASCQETVPQAIFCFLMSNSFEDAVRTAISIGGDSDTLAAITGSIAEAYYNVPETYERHALNRLDKFLTSIYKDFCKNEFSCYKEFHNVDTLSNFDFKKFHINREKFLKENEDESFVIIPGDNNVMISAPHGVSQLRLGKMKNSEPGSLATAIEIKNRTHAHFIAKTKDCGDDANFDDICPYKEVLKTYIKKNKIKYLFDFHSISKDRAEDINLGTSIGFNVAKDIELFDFLCEEFRQKGFVCSIDKPFAAKNGTVAGTLAKTAGIWTIQIEINSRYTLDSENKSRMIDILDCIIKTIEKAKISLK